MNEDVNYTFYNRPKFLSPKPDLIDKLGDKLGDIDETAETVETIEPDDKFLSVIANKFSPKRKTRSIFETPKSRKSPKRSKRRKSRKRKRSKRRSKKRFGLSIMSGMGGLGTVVDY